MKTRNVFFLGLSLAVNGLGCGGSAVLLESAGDGGVLADGSSGTEASVQSPDGGAITDGSSVPEGSCSAGDHCAHIDGSPPPLLDSSAGSSDGGGGGDASACPTGISWASPGPGLGQACATEGQICEDDSCKNNCAEPCNAVQCFECDALQCANGSWQTAVVPLENCDGGVQQTTAPSCSVASDCRLFSDFCGSSGNACTCEVLGAGDPNPSCDAGDGCLQDPCTGLTVVCDQSLHCALQQ